MHARRERNARATEATAEGERETFRDLLGTDGRPRPAGITAPPKTMSESASTSMK